MREIRSQYSGSLIACDSCMCAWAESVSVVGLANAVPGPAYIPMCGRCSINLKQLVGRCCQHHQSPASAELGLPCLVHWAWQSMPWAVLSQYT